MSEFEAVARKLLQEFKTNVLQNTVSSTHSDMLEIADTPILILFMPDIDRIRLDDANVPVQIKDEAAGTVRVFDPPPAYNLSFDYEIIAETTMEVLRIGEKLATFFETTPYLKVNYKEYPVNITAPISSPGGIGPSNLRRATGSFMVEGVEVDIGTFQEGKLVKRFEAVYENLATGGTDQMRGG